MKVLVTGASGFIGSHVCEAFRDAGYPTTGMASHRSQDTFGWLDDVEGVEKVRGDVRDPEQMRSIVEGYNLVCHLAALISVPDSYDRPRSYLETNALGTMNVLLASRDSGAMVINTSTSEVYGTAQTNPMDETHPINPQSPYAASKVAADAIVDSFRRSYGMLVTTLRPFNTYGPRQSERAVIARIIRQALDPDTDEIVLGNLHAERDFTYVTDTARAFVDAIEADFGTYNLGRGEAIRVGEVASIVAGMPAMGVLPGREIKEIVGSEGPTRPRASEVHRLIASNDKFFAQTGWHPTTHLREGLRRTIAWRCKRPILKEENFI